MLVFKSTGEPIKAGSQRSHAQSTKICDKLGFGCGHTNDPNKGHDDQGVTGALNKRHRLPRASLAASTTCSLAELVCSFLRRQSTGRGKLYNSHWGGEDDLSCLAPNAAESSKWKMREQRETPGHTMTPLCVHNSKLPALHATTLENFRKGKSVSNGCADDGHCLCQSSAGENNAKQDSCLWHQAERQTLISEGTGRRLSFRIPLKICLGQSMINANMQVPQIMPKVQTSPAGYQ